jgi:hypothetical protein
MPESKCNAVGRASWPVEALGWGGDGGADSLVRAGPPGPALALKDQGLATSDKPTRGPTADQGVRPTTHADGRCEENAS